MTEEWVPSEVREIVEKARAVMGGADKVAYQVRLLPETNSGKLKRIGAPNRLTASSASPDARPLVDRSWTSPSSGSN